MRTRLREFREKSGISQQNVLPELGVTQQNYSFIEKGGRQVDMSLSLIQKLAKIFGVTAEWIIE